MFISVQRLSDNAYLPTRANAFAAGLDLYAPAAYAIQPGDRQLIPLDIAVEIPMGTFAHILPRSGLALKNGIQVGAGVVDSDYRGNVGVLLFNMGQQVYEIAKGDRIAQMVVKPCLLMDVHETDSLVPTARGSGGFGSTGS